MDVQCTKRLLTRLRDLNGEAPERHMPLGMFGNFFKSMEYKLQTVKPKLLREMRTPAEMTEIDKCRAQIVYIVEELASQQEAALKEQKDITKRCYDMFSKYEGVEQSSAWMRSVWFGLHKNEREERFNKDYIEGAPIQFLPAEWESKMRFGRPSTYRKTEQEIKTEGEAYTKQKEEWETYVDSQWDVAYEDAFRVRAFAQFLKGIGAKMTELDEMTAVDLYRKGQDLHQETLYYTEKISMDHIRIDGWHLSLMKDPAWRRGSEKLQKLTVFMQKLTELRDNVSTLVRLVCG